MNISQEKCLYGFKLSDGRFRRENIQTPGYVFRSFNGNDMFCIDQEAIELNTLVLGGAGSGKTNVINQTLAQALNREGASNSFNVVFDTKADFIKHKNFYKPGDYIIGNNITFYDKSVTWNIFDEVLIDNGGCVPKDDSLARLYEANAKECADILFEGRGSATNPFFVNAARDIFQYTIIYFIRRYRDNYDKWHDKLNNAYLKKFLLTHEAADYAKFFSIYPDTKGLLSYFGDGKIGQAHGVFSELHTMVYDCFQGVFAKEAASPNNYFSVRRAVREKGNRILFVEYDMSTGESLTPMYRLIIDLALKEAVSQENTGRTNFFLDELKLLPKLHHLQDALNFGRSYHLSVVAGIQNIDQLYSNYGESVSKQILEGFANLIALKANDYTTREYVCRRFGPNVTAYRYHNVAGEPTDREREGYAVEHWDQQSLKKGQAIIGLATQAEPFLFHFEIDRFK